MNRITGALAFGCRYGWLAICLLLATPAHAGGIASDLLGDLGLPLLSPAPIRLIVQFNGGGVNSAVVASRNGATLLGTIDSINGAVFSAPLSTVTTLAQDPAVSWISKDLPVAARYDYDTDTTGSRQVCAAPGLSGTGVRVAVLDTGIYPYTSEWNNRTTGRNRLVAFRDLVYGMPLAYDDNGHGTHVAGIAAGSGSMSGGAITGTAPDADLVALKVLGWDGSGLTSTVIQGLDWCVQHRSDLNIGVINLSLGHTPTESYHTDPLCAAVRRAVNAGIVVVCAAGNRGKDSGGNTCYQGIDSPGNEPSALTVGALNTAGTPGRTDDSVCTFSSRGPTAFDSGAKPDVVAPGNRITSVRAPGSYLDALHPENQVRAPGAWFADYYQLSGTSMAAPEVSGIVAQMLQAKPGLDPNTSKAILMYTAQPLSLADGSGAALSAGLSLLTQGAGSVNAVAAVQLAGSVDLASLVGSPWMGSSLPGQSLVNGTWIPWGQMLPWQGRVLSGGDLLAIRQPLWSNGSGWEDPGMSWNGEVHSSDDGTMDETPTVTQDPAPPAQVTWSDTTFRGD